MTRQLLSLVTLIAILGAAAPLAAGSPTRDPYLDFAHHLMKEGDYYRAVTEAKRFLFMHPDHIRRTEAQLLIARAHYQAREFKKALEAFRPVVAQRELPGLAADAILEMGLCLERLDPGGDAIPYYRGLLVEPSLPENRADDIRNTAAFRLGWLLMEAGRWSEARSAFNGVAEEHRLKASARELALTAPGGQNLDYKSPKAAGVMSALLPGAGQLYVGRPVDAGLAFGLNAAFIYGAVEAFHDENWVVFGLLGLFELGWYGGNIYNAVNGAHIHNQNERDRFMKNIRRRHGWRLGYDPERKAVALSWRIDY